jgi:fluoride exporter
MIWIAVFLGGALGSWLRLNLVALSAGASLFSATFVVNILACFLLGWLFGKRESMSPNMLAFALVGFCGGLSTFSSFAAGLVAYSASTGAAFALLRAGAEIAAGLVAAMAGGWLAQQRARL